MEAGVLLDREGKPIHWHLPPGRSGGSLPDSRDLWDVIWENRGNISGFAHSHPGSGLPGPSYTDVTTFAAIEQALGRRLNWFITSSDSWALYRWEGPDKLDYKLLTSDLKWLDRLRAASNYGDPMDILALDGGGTPRQHAVMAQSIREIVDEEILDELERKGTET